MTGSPRDDGRRRSEDRAAPSWVGPAPEPRSGGVALPAPEDGVVASTHPPGPIGAAWVRLMERAGGDARERMVRGRGIARRGRVHQLAVAPGCATAEVVAEGLFRASVRVRAFERAEWERGVTAMREDLSVLGALLEGDLSMAFLRRMATEGINVIPTWAEIQTDCDCGDYVTPCAHVGAVLHVLTDALDGDPFLLLTLRGRTRHQLLGSVRAALGLGEGGPEEGCVDEAPPAGADWFSAPRPMPEFACSLPERVMVGAGLRALGPPPGDGELLTVLSPLYEAGAGAVREVLESATGAQRARRALPPPREAAPPPLDPTEQLVDALAALDLATAPELAEALGWSVVRVTQELVALEALGLVVQKRDRWRVG